MVKSLMSGAEDDRLMRDRKDTVVITGSGGFIGRALVSMTGVVTLAGEYQ